jgi:hypothetical protein
MVPTGKLPTVAPNCNRALLDDERASFSQPQRAESDLLVKHYHAESGSESVGPPLAEAEAELRITRLTVVETTSVFANGLRDDGEDVGHSEMRAMRC